MTCGQIQDEETIERYARHQLSLEEERAFEEHFFSCDQCFDKLQATEHFIAGLRDAAQRRLLDSGAAATEKMRGWWLFPGFALSAAAAVVLAGLLIWVFLVRVPGLRRERDELSARLHAEQGLRAELEKAAGRESAIQGNVPFVMLEATRQVGSSNEVAVPAGARHLIVWVELPAERRLTSFRLGVYTPDNHLLESVGNLRRNSYGALVVDLTTPELPAGDYLLKLSSEAPPPPSPVAEYRLKVHRP